MAEPTPATGQPDGGFIRNLRLFFSAASSYVQTRAELAGIESREAAGHYTKALLWVAVALFGVLFGYVFLMAGLVLVLVHFTGLAAMWVVLLVALLHFVVAIAGLLLAWRKIGVPQFSLTMAQFKKDREWLKK